MPEVDIVARAIYNAHWGLETLPNHRQSPPWENTSENVKNFVRNQARDAMRMCEHLRNQKLRTP